MLTTLLELGLLGVVAASSAVFLKWFLVYRRRTYSFNGYLTHLLLNTVMGVMGKRAVNALQKESLDALDSQAKYLMKILKDSENTEYGKRYDFASIKDVDDFRQKHPLTRYDHYEDYVRRLGEGETNLLSSYKLTQLALTSGTSGTPKLLPSTSKQGVTFFMKGITVIYHVMLTQIKGYRNIQKTCKIMYMPKHRETAAGIMVGPNSSSPKSNKSILKLYSTPEIGYYIPTEKEALYIHALFALRDRHLGTIEANFVFLIFNLFTFIEHSWPSLVNDIRHGTIDPSISIPDNIYKQLLKSNTPDALRANELETEFAKGFRGIAKRIWPTLNLILSVNTGSVALYASRLEYYIETGEGVDPVVCYSPLYGASEGLMGVNLDPNGKSYVLVPSALFFEFIPLAQSSAPSHSSSDHDEAGEMPTLVNDQPDTLLIHQVQRDECYELVITNPSGLFRYRVGDVIKVVDFMNTLPIIEFQFRIGQLLNVRGEKTSEKSFYEAMRSEKLRWGGDTLVDYTSFESLWEEGVSAQVPSYSVYVELENETLLTDEDRHALDQQLCLTNPIYQTFREKSSIDPLILNVVKKGTFSRLRDLMIENGSGANQVKTPRVLRAAQHVHFVQENRIQTLA